jgi:hypothetical protein
MEIQEVLLATRNMVIYLIRFLITGSSTVNFPVGHNRHGAILGVSSCSSPILRGKRGSRALQPTILGKDDFLQYILLGDIPIVWSKKAVEYQQWNPILTG